MRFTQQLTRLQRNNNPANNRNGKTRPVVCTESLCQGTHPFLALARVSPSPLLAGGGLLSGTEIRLPLCVRSGLSLGDVPNRQPIGIVLTVLGVVILDFSADATEGPIRAYLLDVVDSEEQDMALNIHAFSAGESMPSPCPSPACPGTTSVGQAVPKALPPHIRRGRRAGWCWSARRWAGRC